MEQQISIQEAIKWIAKMAAKDGVISHNERKLLKEFADKHHIDTNKLYRLAYAFTKDAQQEVELASTNEIKGRRFEEFVVSLITDKSRYKLLAWRSDKIIGNTYAAENLYPDLHLRHKLSSFEVEYFIECKYRSSWGNGKINLSKQFSRYCDFAKTKNCRLFFALGIGGTPSNPDEFYIIPSHLINSSKCIIKENINTCSCDISPEAFNQLIQNHFLATP